MKSTTADAIPELRTTRTRGSGPAATVASLVGSKNPARLISRTSNPNQSCAVPGGTSRAQTWTPAAFTLSRSSCNRLVRCGM
ncbi:hypothetical protein ACFQ0T_42265 [Kitasatospora gansuensis]